MWSVDDVAAVQAYRGLSGGRHAKLFGLLSAIAKSAYNKGYLLDDYELADLVWQEHEANRPSSPYTFRQILNKAARAIGEAEAITDPYFETAHNWRTWGQAEPWKYGTEGIMSFTEMMEDYRRDPPQPDELAEDPATDEPQPYDSDDEPADRGEERWSGEDAGHQFGQPEGRRAGNDPAGPRHRAAGAAAPAAGGRYSAWTPALWRRTGP